MLSAAVGESAVIRRRFPPLAEILTAALATIRRRKWRRRCVGGTVTTDGKFEFDLSSRSFWREKPLETVKSRIESKVVEWNGTIEKMKCSITMLQIREMDVKILELTRYEVSS